jgi:hypothetical protein
MAKTKIEDDKLKTYIKEVMQNEYLKKHEEEDVISYEEKEESTRLKNQVNSIYEFALSHPTQQTEATRGTVWGAYNSISGYFNHVHKFNKGAEQKFTSQFFGNAYTKINKGFQKAYQLI